MPFYKFKVLKSRAGESLPDLGGCVTPALDGRVSRRERLYDLNEQAFLWIGELADAFPEKEFLLLYSGFFGDKVEAFLEFQCDTGLDVQEVADILFDEEQYDPFKARVWPAETAVEEQIVGVWFSGLNEPEMTRIF